MTHLTHEDIKQKTIDLVNDFIANAPSLGLSNAIEIPRFSQSNQMYSFYRYELAKKDDKTADTRIRITVEIY